MDLESLPISEQPSKSFSVPLLLTFCAISTLLIYLVYSKNFIFGSIIGRWVYPFLDKEVFIPLWIPVVIFTIIALMIFVGTRLVLSYEKSTLIVCFFLAVIIQVLIQKVYPNSLESIIRNDISTSFYSQAMLTPPVDVLTHFITLAPSFLLHARTNMPGKILLFQLLEVITKSPEVLGYMIISLSTSGAFLLYGICINLIHDRRTAFYAFILYSLIPSKLIFSPLLNSVTPVFMLLCFYLFLIYINKKNVLFLGMLGGVLYLLVLFEPSPLVTGIMYIGVLIYSIGKNKLSKKDIIQILIIPAFVFLAVYLFFSLVFSFDLLNAVEYLAKDAVNFNLTEGRGYQIWLAENSKEFFYAVGFPIMMIFIFQMIQIISEWKIKVFNIKNWSLESVICVSVLITFLFVLFSGINRGEITRLWIYLAVFFQVPASLFMARISKRNILFFCVTCILVAQTIVALSKVAFIRA